jgi:hypothetical protein
MGAQTEADSHHQYSHADKGMVVTVSGHPGKDVPAGTLNLSWPSSVQLGRRCVTTNARCPKHFHNKGSISDVR